MLFMNEYDIQDAAREYAGHAILGPATKTLLALADWTNRNSDGWAYWPKPCRAARALQELIQSHQRDLRETGGARVGTDELKRAYRPIRSFATRHGADFPIYLPES
jgi:hypothetical protein